MIALLQRVSQAGVEISGQRVADIGQGLLVLLGVEKQDDDSDAQNLAKRVANYRVFADSAGKMNCSVTDIQGRVLAVPQFTLPADTGKGRRPSFSRAASPEQGEQLFKAFVEALAGCGLTVATGRFGADMQVSLINDGPVTFWLQTRPK